MPTVAETAYPRLKNQVREKELTKIYTPTPEELNLASQHTRKRATKLGFLYYSKPFKDWAILLLQRPSQVRSLNILQTVLH